jgi:hypothetical protein
MTGPEELTNAYTLLIDYLQGISSYNEDASNVLPSFADIAGQFTNNQLYVEALQRSATETSIAVGMTAQACDMIQAIMREAVLRGFSKAEYYTLGASTSNNDIAFFSNRMYTEAGAL